jgi:hypothetical protein
MDLNFPFNKSIIVHVEANFQSHPNEKDESQKLEYVLKHHLAIT